MCHRFVNTGGKPPEGVKLLGRWHAVGRVVGFAIAESNDLAPMQKWALDWSDLLSLDVYPAQTDEEFGPLAALRDGLGFLSGSACPHYDGEKDRRPTYQRLVRGGFPAGYAADDAAALHFVGADLVACVASRATAGGYRVRAASETVTETPLSVRLLG